MNSAVVIDVDGTITNFKEHDNKIIQYLFGKSNVVMFLDKILWWINSKDVMTNRFWMFKIRIFVYSLLSFTSYSNNMKYYEKEYVKESEADMYYGINYVYPYFEKLGYKVFLISHGHFEHDRRYANVIFTKNKAEYIFENVLTKFNVKYIIGDNFSDDILTGFRISKFYPYVRTVYIGKSKLVLKMVKLLSKKTKKFEVYNTLKLFMLQFQGE